jgi:hypothetical protein
MSNQTNEIKKEDKKASFTQSEKAKKGWMFSVFFLILILCLVMFLSYVPLQADNRDVIVGIIGTITGSIGSMIAIAAGRDPAEIDELKDQLAKSEGDRMALIARLRDSQIQMQLLREQIFELQNAVINKLSIFVDENPIKVKKTNEVKLHSDVEKWLPKQDEK